MRMEITKKEMDILREFVAHSPETIFFPSLEGDSFDNLVEWILEEMKQSPDGIEPDIASAQLVATLMVLSVIAEGAIPSNEYEIEELRNLFDFIKNVGEDEFFTNIFKRWVSYETPNELLIREGFRKTA